MTTTLGAATMPILTGLPAGQPCPIARVADGAAMSQAIDDYLADGYDIERASDGWVLLRAGGRRIALTIVAR
ncbi:hypothetical protein AB0N89_19870 [Amycolatopsis sp. NPDC089917]|uniref:hypothetical protein n=1 Tax=Amycolatopsis sp. NPDC089917 TaxID=3155187 RepID=UPI00342E525F